MAAVQLYVMEWGDEPLCAFATSSKPYTTQTSTEYAVESTKPRVSPKPKHDDHQNTAQTSSGSSSVKRTTNQAPPTKPTVNHQETKPSSKSKQNNDRPVADASSGQQYTLIVRLTDVDCENKVLKLIDGYQNQRTITLEKALNPLRDHIRHLDDFIRYAKQRANMTSASTLTHDESAAIFLYTVHWNDTCFSRELNRALRSEDQTDLKRGHVYQGITRKIKEKYPKNKTITWSGVTSCTYSKDLLVPSLLGEKSTLLNIIIRNGKDISEYSCNSNETEIILLSGTRLRVTDVTNNTDLNMDEIDLEEITDELPKAEAFRLPTTKRISQDGSF
ncbi:unnamed protein product, partial [Rotaria sordida]